MLILSIAFTFTVPTTHDCSVPRHGMAVVYHHRGVLVETTIAPYVPTVLRV